MGGIAALVTPPLAAHESEIPAFAGMVFRGTGNYWWILAIMRATIGRFGGGGGQQCQNTPTHSRYPTRPFLRRQESHNKRRQRRVESAAGGMSIVAHTVAKIRQQPPASHKTIPA